MNEVSPRNKGSDQLKYWTNRVIPSASSPKPEKRQVSVNINSHIKELLHVAADAMARLLKILVRLNNLDYFFIFKGISNPKVSIGHMNAACRTYMCTLDRYVEHNYPCYIHTEAVI